MRWPEARDLEVEEIAPSLKERSGIDRMIVASVDRRWKHRLKKAIAKPILATASGKRGHFTRLRVRSQSNTCYERSDP